MSENSPLRKSGRYDKYRTLSHFGLDIPNCQQQNHFHFTSSPSSHSLEHRAGSYAENGPDESLIDVQESELSHTVIPQPESIDQNDLMADDVEENSNSTTDDASEMTDEDEVFQENVPSSHENVPIILKDVEKEFEEHQASTQESKEPNELNESSDVNTLFVEDTDIQDQIIESPVNNSERNLFQTSSSPLSQSSEHRTGSYVENGPDESLIKVQESELSDSQESIDQSDLKSDDEEENSTTDVASEMTDEDEVFQENVSSSHESSDVEDTDNQDQIFESPLSQSFEHRAGSYAEDDSNESLINVQESELSDSQESIDRSDLQSDDEQENSTKEVASEMIDEDEVIQEYVSSSHENVPIILKDIEKEFEDLQASTKESNEPNELNESSDVNTLFVEDTDNQDQIIESPVNNSERNLFQTPSSPSSHSFEHRAGSYAENGPDESLINVQESELSHTVTSLSESIDWNDLMADDVEENSNSTTDVASEMIDEDEVIQEYAQSSLGKLPIIFEDVEKELEEHHDSIQESKEQNERRYEPSESSKSLLSFAVENIRNDSIDSVKLKKQDKSIDSDTELRFFDEVKMLLDADNHDEMIERIDNSLKRTTAAYEAVDVMQEEMENEREICHEEMIQNLSNDETIDDQITEEGKKLSAKLLEFARLINRNLSPDKKHLFQILCRELFYEFCYEVKSN